MICKELKFYFIFLHRMLHGISLTTMIGQELRGIPRIIQYEVSMSAWDFQAKNHYGHLIIPWLETLVIKSDESHVGELCQGLEKLN